MVDILLIESFYDGSHRALIDLIERNTENRSILLTLPGRKWPWRARCSSLILSQKIPSNEKKTLKYLFSSSTNNLSELISLRPDLCSLKKIVYFHENDLVYPKQNDNEQRDFQFGYNQILTCLVADLCIFNSEYNLSSFIEHLGPFLHRIPSPKPDVQQIRKTIENKSKVIFFPLTKPTIELKIDRTDKTGPLTIVWPHRWEHDKDPQTFFSIILQLYQDYSLKFQLIILGQSYGEQPEIFEKVYSQLPKEYIYHWGFANSKSEYENLLCQGDVVVSTAQHEFFGVAMLEACRAGCLPIVPDRLSYKELYPNEEHRYRTDRQLLKKLKFFCENPDFVRQKSAKFETSNFEWEKNEQLRNEYLSLFMPK